MEVGCLGNSVFSGDYSANRKHLCRCVSGGRDRVLSEMKLLEGNWGGASEKTLPVQLRGAACAWVALGNGRTLAVSGPP